MFISRISAALILPLLLALPAARAQDDQDADRDPVKQLPPAEAEVELFFEWLEGVPELRTSDLMWKLPEGADKVRVLKALELMWKLPEQADKVRVLRTLLWRAHEADDPGPWFAVLRDLRYPYEQKSFDQTLLLRALGDLSSEQPLREGFPTEAIRGAWGEGGGGKCRDLPAREALENTLGRPFNIAAFVDPAIEGSISYRLGVGHWPEELDLICAVVGCRWRVVGGDVAKVEVSSAPLRFATVSVDALDRRAGDVLEEVASDVGIQAVVDPRISSEVEIQVEGIEWPTALDLVCRRAGCRWQLEEGEPRLLRFAVTDDSEPLSLDRDFIGVPLGEVVTALAEMRGLEPQYVGQQGLYDRELPVTLASRGLSWSEAMDALCGEMSCNWSIRRGGILWIQPDVEMFSPTEYVTPFEMVASVEDSSGRESTCAIRFTLDRQLVLLGKGGDEDSKVLLSWVPFNRRLQAVFPVVVLDRSGRSHLETLHQFEPIQLPLTEPWRGEAKGLVIGLSQGAGQDLPQCDPPNVSNWGGIGGFELEVLDENGVWVSTGFVGFATTCRPTMVRPVNALRRQYWRGDDPLLAIMAGKGPSVHQYRILATYPSLDGQNLETKTLTFGMGGVQELRIPMEGGTELDLRVSFDHGSRFQ